MAEDLRDMKTDEVIVAAGEMVTEDHLPPLKRSGNDQAYVRSVLVCESNVAFVQHVMAATWPEAQL